MNAPAPQPRTALVCTTCGTRNTDPGGDITGYRCGACGHQTLVRVQPPADRTGEVIAAAAAGGALGGALFGVPGALIGVAIGGLLAGVRR